MVPKILMMKMVNNIGFKLSFECLCKSLIGKSPLLLISALRSSILHNISTDSSLYFLMKIGLDDLLSYCLS
jgi:hypothetical protein